MPRAGRLPSVVFRLHSGAGSQGPPSWELSVVLRIIPYRLIPLLDSVRIFNGDPIASEFAGCWSTMEMIETKNDEYVPVGVLLITSLIALSSKSTRAVPCRRGRMVPVTALS